MDREAGRFLTLPTLIKYVSDCPGIDRAMLMTAISFITIIGKVLT